MRDTLSVDERTYPHTVLLHLRYLGLGDQTKCKHRVGIHATIP